MSAVERLEELHALLSGSKGEGKEAAAASAIAAESGGMVLRQLSATALASRFNGIAGKVRQLARQQALSLLFLPHIEKWLRVVSSFETVSNPIKALTHYVMGQQLLLARQVWDTAKTNWHSGAHPKDVLVAAIAKHASPDMVGKFLLTYTQVERWWSANVKGGKLNAREGRLSTAANALPSPAAGAPAPALVAAPSRASAVDGARARPTTR